MIIKELPEDFIVEELYDIEKFKEKGEDRESYYFILTKRDYAQLRALERVSKVFKVSRKNIHFAGTKDKKALTKQIISLQHVNENTWKENVDYFNNSVKDMSLEYLGIFNGRVNLGDNLGNKFTITLRDLSSGDIETIEKRADEIREDGVMNYFDSQRFGFSNNSHIIGKYVLLNDLESACKEVLMSLPPNPFSEAKEYVEELDKNWSKIKDGDQKEISRIISLMPRFYRDEKKVLQHLHNYKNDFPGAFRTIHKKLRTLYIAAYQSYLFNEVLKRCESLPSEIELFTYETQYEGEIKEVVDELLAKDGLSRENFKLESTPELRPIISSRKVKLGVSDLEILEVSQDELYEGKMKLVVSFSLESGAYATNVIKELML